MKKSVLLFLCIFLLVLTACSNEDSVSTVTSEMESIPLTTVEMTEPPTEAPPETTEPVLQTYPLNVGKAYHDFAVTPPDHIYNTLGSENGLAGTIYTFDGTVTAIEEMTASGFIYPIAKVDTDHGPVMILDMYTAVYNASLKRAGKNSTESLYDDNPAFYKFPDVGESANFIAVYMGYSEAESLATFIYGASPDIFTIGEYPDPVVISLEESGQN